MLKISTICSAYNSFEKIDLLINSFLSQQYNNKELLVIDGSKNIKQSQLLKNKFKNYKNIKIYHLKNSSIYKCLNFGIKKSSVSSWKTGHRRLGFVFTKVKEGNKTLWKIEQY